MTIGEEFSDLLDRTVVMATKVVAGAVPLFSQGTAVKDAGSPAAQRAMRVLFPDAPPGFPAPPPLPPVGGDAGGLHDGAERAGQGYGGSVTAAATTDQKVSELVQQILARNDAARGRIEAILAEIRAKATQIGPDLGDPAALMTYHQFVEQKFGEIQKLLDESRVDAKSQAAIMDALGSEYRTNAPVGGGSGGGQQAGSGSDEQSGGGSGADAGGQGGGAGGQGGDAGGGADGGGADGGGQGGGAGTAGGGGAGGVVDPLAGLGLGGLGSLGGMDPMAMMAPALAGLGGLPGAFGGLGGGLGGGGLGLDGLGPALGSLIPGLRDSFGDKPGTDIGRSAEFSETAAKPEPPKAEQFSDGTAGPGGGAKPEQPKSPEFVDQEGADGQQPTAAGPSPAATQPAGGPPLAAEAPTPVAAAPAAAPGQAPAPGEGTAVTLPDGTPVTAPDTERAAAMRAVLAGSTVSEAYHGAVPPPGTAVLSPVSRGELQPGDYGQFTTKAPIMYMGNNRIWMDGQLQPISALPSSPDFLGWSPPPAGAGQHQASAATPPPPAPAPPAGK